MEQKTRYGWKKIAGIGLTSCLLGIVFATGGIAQAQADETMLLSEELPSELPSELPKETVSPVEPTPSTEKADAETLPEPTLPSEKLPPELPSTTPKEPTTSPSEPMPSTETVDTGTMTDSTLPSEELPKDKVESEKVDKPKTEETKPSTETEKKQPLEEKKENTEKPVEKTAEKPKEVNISIDSTGKVTNGGVQVMPVITTNPKEITNVPTPTMPVIADNGTKIVSVRDGVPYTQTEKGLEIANVQYKKLPSGNIEVTAQDGTKKVLPQTGTKTNSWLYMIAGILTIVVGAVSLIIKKRMNKE